MQAALAAATNELTVAALNINFDFTLMKCKAPKEYQNLGNVLSRKKKAEAETGTAHTTAMRLGALFDGVCPPTPNLIKAYGVRVSEIAESATKQETSNGGIFSDYTGVDGTSIWASATSSSAALQVQLLACLLARVWKPSFATSIWFELVKERRQEIAEKYESGEDVAFGSMSAAAKSEISRENLADWDASARAWLQMADRAKEREQKKLRLIIDNVDTAVSKDNNVLSSVLEVWKAAVTTMESLLNGMPQAVESGPVLLALSSWYIYPDILVASGGIKEVNFEDNIIPSGAKFTIGLSPSSSGGESRGVYWSLSLKHLQHYGHPVQSKALLDQDVSKITFLEFSQAVFGTLMGNWDIQGDDVLVACTVFMSFHKAFEKAAATCDEASPQLQMEALAFLRDKSQWWNILVSAAAAILDSSDVLARKLVRLGLRRAPQFLPTRDLPFFGLLDSAYIIRYLKSPEDRIIFLRRMANAAPTDAMASQRPLLIRYYPSTTEQSQFRHLATAVPVPKPPYRRETKTIDGSLEIEYEHERWVHLGYKCEFTDEKAIFLEQDPVTFEAVDERGRKVLHLSSITGISGTYAKVSGVKRVAEIYQNENVPAVPIRKPVMEDMLWILEQDMFEAGAVIEHLKNLSLDFPVNQTVTALGIASKIYQAVPTASVSVEVLNKPLYHTNWFRPSTNPPKPKTFQYKAARSSEIFIPRHIAFSCVAYFGCSADIEPDLLGNVFAMAYEESLYIASEVKFLSCNSRLYGLIVCSLRAILVSTLNNMSSRGFLEMSDVLALQC
jgi:hypothetical protein